MNRTVIQNNNRSIWFRENNLFVTNASHKACKNSTATLIYKIWLITKLVLLSTNSMHSSDKLSLALLPYFPLLLLEFIYLYFDFIYHYRCEDPALPSFVITQNEAYSRDSTKIVFRWCKALFKIPCEFSRQIWHRNLF